MPILYNFHIFFETFYMIYWTNLLIQCPVPVPVLCMFLPRRKSISNEGQMQLNFMENYFGIYVIFGSWNHRKRRPTQPTRHLGVPEAPGVWWWVVPSSNISWISTSGARNLISRKKSCKKISSIGVRDIREYKKRFSARSRERET